MKHYPKPGENVTDRISGKNPARLPGALPGAGQLTSIHSTFKHNTCTSCADQMLAYSHVIANPYMHPTLAQLKAHIPCVRYPHRFPAQIIPDLGFSLGTDRPLLAVRVGDTGTGAPFIPFLRTAF